MCPARMTAVDKLFKKIAEDWKHNRITYAIALHRLCEIGWSIDQAAHWLADN